MGLDVASALAFLAEERPVFHSEADFQHGLAWQIHCPEPAAQLRLETRPVRGTRLDILVRLDGRRIAIELKYLLARFHGTVAGEVYDLPNQGAQDISRHDVIKDITRVENLVRSGWADSGWVIALSNDPSYWRPGRGAPTIDAAFRLDDGRRLSGSLNWAPHAGAGTTRGRDIPLVLDGSYDCHRQPYSAVPDSTGRQAEFRYLALAIDTVRHTTDHRTTDPHGNGTARQETVVTVATPPAATPTAPRSSSPDRAESLRDQILRVARVLSSRSVDGTFTVADVVAEFRRNRSPYAESTIRTHVTSRMCANAPDHHAVVYPDLERVDRGIYRLLV